MKPLCPHCRRISTFLERCSNCGKHLFEQSSEIVTEAKNSLSVLLKKMGKKPPDVVLPSHKVDQYLDVERRASLFHLTSLFAVGIAPHAMDLIMPLATEQVSDWIKAAFGEPPEQIPPAVALSLYEAVINGSFDDLMEFFEEAPGVIAKYARAVAFVRYGQTVDYDLMKSLLDHSQAQADPKSLNLLHAIALNVCKLSGHIVLARESALSRFTALTNQRQDWDRFSEGEAVAVSQVYPLVYVTLTGDDLYCGQSTVRWEPMEVAFQYIMTQENLDLSKPILSLDQVTSIERAYRRDLALKTLTYKAMFDLRTKGELQGIPRAGYNQYLENLTEERLNSNVREAIQVLSPMVIALADAGFVSEALKLSEYSRNFFLGNHRNVVASNFGRDQTNQMTLEYALNIMANSASIEKYAHVNGFDSDLKIRHEMNSRALLDVRTADQGIGSIAASVLRYNYVNAPELCPGGPITETHLSKDTHRAYVLREGYGRYNETVMQ